MHRSNANTGGSKPKTGGQQRGRNLSGSHHRPHSSQFTLATNDSLQDLVGAVGGVNTYLTSQNTGHVAHRARAQSENRSGGTRLAVHQTSSGNPYRTHSGHDSNLHSGQSNQARRGTSQTQHRGRSQHASHSGVRGQDGSFFQARGQKTPHQHSNSSGNWQHHNRPGRSGNQNSMVYNYQLITPNQPKQLSYGHRTSSMQNLHYPSNDLKVVEGDCSLKPPETHTVNKSKTYFEKRIDSRTIKYLASLEPAELVLKLAAPGSGLKKFLNESNSDFQVVQCFLEVINTAIRCASSRQNLIYILSQLQKSTFLNQTIPYHYLNYSTFHMQESKPFSLVEHTAVLLTELVSVFPFSSFLEVTLVKTFMQNAVDELKRSGKMCPQDIQQKLDCLTALLMHLEEKKKNGTLRSDNSIYYVGSRDNIDEDFRNTTIYPRHEDFDLTQNPILRPNIIHTSYPNTKTYLDTHFRLLREDFIRPLREGISKLLSLQDKEIVRAKFDNIRIYFDTQIIAPVFTKNGIIHTVKFNTNNLKQVRWESSKRLLFGSLVCLSQDNFKNMLFATVADRNIPDLQKGQVSLTFTEESRQKLGQHVVADTFLMVEATAYFEAYRHVLEGLKELVDSDVPFKNYIVDCNTVMSPPKYLSQNISSYRLDMLMQKNQDANPSPFLYLNEYFGVKQQFNVLNHRTWPTKEQLNLDRSQFQALQMALTSELSIVQGPPGTGKTYIGLKIVYALLSNSEVWKEGHSPILIVCFTNHALDQFLEGILSFMECNIVRVGSRSNSEKMQNCSLSKIRSKKSRGSLPGHMRALHAEITEEKKKVQGQLLEKASKLRVATTGILQENILEKFMNPDHYISLMFAKSLEISPTDFQTDSIIVEWLCISPSHAASSQDLINLEDEIGSDESGVTHSKFEDLEEGDFEDVIKIDEEAELAEAERMIDEDDDVKQQIKMAERTATKTKTEILAFILDENDEQANKPEEEGWQMQKDVKKKMKKRIKYELEKTSHIDEEKSNMISDLWAIPPPIRWELYRLWRAKYLTSIRDDIFTLESTYQILVNRSSELRSQEDQLLLQEADIIGMTTTGAAKNRKLLQNIQPKIVVVEEAAEVLEAHIITTLSSGCQHLILIGDHQQLRPSTTDYDLARNFNLEVSMFERLIKMKVPYVRLDYQHRMRAEIARLLTPHIYNKLENHESVLKFENIKGVCSNLFFLTHDHPEEHIKEGKSHQNVHEAAFAKCLCLYFLQQGYPPSQITILTTYSGQLYCIQKMMPRSKFEGVRVCVVDKYQGEENEIIILSLVRSNVSGNVGFLQIPNRVCVALSRAKKGLFCIGNMQLLSTVPLWKNINDTLTENGQIGRELKLQCVNHPNTINYVSVSEDFDRTPEGGCMAACEHRLDCGHMCIRQCHPYDPEHKTFKCTKPCVKVICENGHRCKKRCVDPCGNCLEPVEKKISTCGHIQTMPCSASPDKFICKESCTKTLQCGHQCARTCGEICTQNCTEKVDIALECGHLNKISCHKKIEVMMADVKVVCQVPCGEELSCGHLCPGTCSSCVEQGSHMTCTKPCGVVLLCSHGCEQSCSSECFCIRSCESKCSHMKKCPSKCSDPCKPCRKLCGWNCKHKKCTKLCLEPCDRDPCDETCQKALKCGHPCIGLCGEPCPKKCRTCNADEMEEWFFDKEYKPEAKFVQLLDCPHIFEETRLSEWMNQPEENYVIKLKTCPKCSVPIRQNVRYGNMVKQTLLDLEAVKERIAGKWLNCLEVFLWDNEAELKHFAEVEKSMQKLKDDVITLRILMLVCEKLKFWKNLGKIKNTLEPFSHVINSWGNVHKLAAIVESATNTLDILKTHDELFILALRAEYIILQQKGLLVHAENIKALVTKLETKTLKLVEVQTELKKIPFHLELISSIENSKHVIDTEMLRQGNWHKCPAGHIYNTNENSGINCPQCSDDESDDEESDN
uniref:NFX1-type zinc finger-containing protein 1 n=1 Tax=Leptobrachium leishanense TaxID=445787 RepID=A0A8C5MB86_9ANUR